MSNQSYITPGSPEWLGGKEQVPEVLTVRVTKKRYPNSWYALGAAFKVNNISGDKYEFSKIPFAQYLIFKSDCEIIPDFDKTKYRLMSRDELVLEGDIISSTVRGWEKVEDDLIGFPRPQCTNHIYLRPLPQQEERDEPKWFFGPCINRACWFYCTTSPDNCANPKIGRKQFLKKRWESLARKIYDYTNHPDNRGTAVNTSVVMVEEWMCKIEEGK